MEWLRTQAENLGLLPPQRQAELIQQQLRQSQTKEDQRVLRDSLGRLARTSFDQATHDDVFGGRVLTAVASAQQKERVRSVAHRTERAKDRDRVSALDWTPELVEIWVKEVTDSTDLASQFFRARIDGLVLRVLANTPPSFGDLPTDDGKRLTYDEDIRLRITGVLGQLFGIEDSGVKDRLAGAISLLFAPGEFDGRDSLRMNQETQDGMVAWYMLNTARVRRETWGPGVTNRLLIGMIKAVAESHDGESGWTQPLTRQLIDDRMKADGVRGGSKRRRRTIKHKTGKRKLYRRRYSKKHTSKKRRTAKRKLSKKRNISKKTNYSRKR